MGLQRQVGLDAVRGAAILLVLLFHLGQPTGVALLDGALVPFRIAGWAGVELFFVLSGFLVGQIILAGSDGAGGFDRRRFLLRRAFRLWPILYLYIGVLALTGAGFDRLWPVLLHVQNYSDAASSHLWSLAVEEHFYLVAALALPWLWRRIGAMRLVALLGALIAATIFARSGALAAGVAQQNVHWQSQYRIDALAAGVILAVVRRERPHWLAAVQRRRGRLMLIALAFFVPLLTAPEVLRRTGLDLTLAWLAAVPLVVAAADAVIPALLARPARLLAALGRIAYPLYIWHVSIAAVAGAAAAMLGVAHPLALTVVRWSAAIAAAALLHRAVEAPFMALLDRARHAVSRNAQNQSIRV